MPLSPHHIPQGVLDFAHNAALYLDRLTAPCVIGVPLDGLAWTLNCSANSAGVLSPLAAAKATCVLNVPP